MHTKRRGRGVGGVIAIINSDQFIAVNNLELKTDRRYVKEMNFKKMILLVKRVILSIVFFLSLTPMMMMITMPITKLTD